MGKLRRKIYAVIQPSEGSNAASSVFDWFIITLILINVFLVILDTFSGISEPAKRVFSVIETVSVIIFTAEYLLRLQTADLLFPNSKNARIKYMFSFMALIDLLAILPFYLPFIIPIDLRVLRMVRLLRLLRLLKVNRYTSALSAVGNVLRKKATQLLSSLFVVMILMVIASVLMYSIEYDAQPGVFENAFSGFWWAIATMTTVGYGDIYPITVTGKILGALIALLGIGLVAVPTGIISAGFVEIVDQKNENGAKRFCPYCGNRID